MSTEAKDTGLSKEKIAALAEVQRMLGLSHLSSAEIARANLDYHPTDDRSISRIFDHLAECRMCRKKVRKLTLSDFKRAYPVNFNFEYIEQQYGYYMQTDPPPFFDEKITFREKLYRLIRYRENYFFDAEDARRRIR